MRLRQFCNRIAGALLAGILAFSFQNCGPAKLTGQMGSLEIASSERLGTKVDLVTLLNSQQEPASNVLYPPSSPIAEHKYSIDSDIIENIVLKTNHFERIEWVHEPTATVVAIGEVFPAHKYSSEFKGVYYIFGYRGQQPSLLGHLKMNDKGSTTVGANSTNAVQVSQKTISSDGTNETILVSVEAPDVDLSSVQYVFKNNGDLLQGRRALLISKKLTEKIDLDIKVSDRVGNSVTKPITLAAAPPPPPMSCQLNGQMISNGSSITAYQASTVPFSSSCVSQSRTCTNGTLSGSYPSSTCTVAPASTCVFNGNMISNGAAVTAFQSSSVPFGSTCASQTRSCSNGTLSGSYQFASCSVDAQPDITLSVQGAPNLPINGTTTPVTIGFAVGTPTKVELSRDGGAPFAIWPNDNWFTRSADGKSLTGNWCINRDCWGGISGNHTLKAVATYANGVTSTETMNINVVPSTTQVLPMSANLTARRGQSFTFSVSFNAKPMSADYHYFIHFVDANGNQYTPLNSGGGPSPTTLSWNGPVSYTKTLTVPADAPAGTYTVRVGLYVYAPPYTERAQLDRVFGVSEDLQMRYTVGTLTISP